MRYEPDGCVWRSTPGYLAIAREDGSLVECEGTAADVWRLVVDGRSVDEVVSTLAGEYGAELEVVRADADVFVRQMVERGLLRPVDD